MGSEVNSNFSEVQSDFKNDGSFKLKAAIFLSTITGLSAAIGFGATLAAVKKQDPQAFEKGMTSTLKYTEAGGSLALRALGWGTVYAFTGCGILFYSIWKLSGATTMEEFRYKVGSILPKIPKNSVPERRTEFSGLTDLLNYLQHEKSSKDE